MPFLDIEQGATYLLAFYKDPVKTPEGRPPTLEHIQYAVGFANTMLSLQLYMLHPTSQWKNGNPNKWDFHIQHADREDLLNNDRAILLTKIAEPGAYSRTQLPTSKSDKTFTAVYGKVKADHDSRPHFIHHYGSRFAISLAMFLLRSGGSKITFEELFLETRLAVGENLIKHWPRSCCTAASAYCIAQA